MAGIPPIAQVEPLTTARSLRGPFDYLLPDSLAGVGVGSLLVVPFGRRRVLGVVTGLASSTEVPPDRLVAPLEALSLGVPPDLVRLGEWMAAEYCSTPARALSLVLPPGAGAGMREKTALVAELTPAGRAPAERARLRDDPPGEAEAGLPRLGSRQLTALATLSRGPLPAAEVPGGHGVLRRLEARGLVTLRPEARRRRPVHARVGAASAQPPALTADQAAALGPIQEAVVAGRGGRFLLHGVTASGKTEVYLRATAAALERGRGAIVLVPEIALTPQIVGRFEARFGPTVAVLHSGMGDGERHDEWLRLRRGEARVCVGPRSAVFAPVAGLGLLIVDEEHEPSYKHEGDPRYDARRVAERRAHDTGAVLIAGSATPRPETAAAAVVADASRQGTAVAGTPGAGGFRRLRLPERVDGRPLPPVELLDMREVRGALHPLAHAALERVRREGSKAIVLLNRRGWSNFLSCRSCGKVWECPDCDVALVLHRSDGALACHHCGHREPARHACDACGSTSVARHGAGTERLEADLAAAFGEAAGGDDGAGARPGFPVFRLDADAAAGKGAAGDVLAAFDAAPCGVLVGTQMVAKGHDFPGVTLGLVLDADATLRFPDFRAEERTFALVAQLAGRAGRGPRGGAVLVQTIDPGASVLAHAARHDSDGFLAEELARREALGYPPFADLVRVVCASAEPGAATAAARAVRARLEIPTASILGPAPLFRLRGRERAQIVVKARDRAAAVRAVGAAVEATAAEKAHRAAAFSVDVDPQ